MGRGDTTTQRRIVPPAGRPSLVPARAAQSRIAPSLAAEKPRSTSKLTTARGRCPLWMDHGWCWLSRPQGSCFLLSPQHRGMDQPRQQARGVVAGRRGTCVGGWGDSMQVRSGLTGPQSSRPGLPGLLWLFISSPNPHFFSCVLRDRTTDHLLDRPLVSFHFQLVRHHTATSATVT